MCGICGLVAARDFDNILLERMHQILEHRGPDDWGTQLFHSSDRIIGFAHRRLSIIDLSEMGHQPMQDDDNTICIIFNGEIYNFRYLRHELLQKGYSFRGSSDTEVILYAYKEWGIECVKKLQGMFAFAIYDKTANRLFLARDRVGIKPLYYYHQGTDFIFASELKSLLLYDNFSKQIDIESLYQYLSFQYIPAPRSIFKNTYKLEPGHYLLLNIGADEVVTVPYWDSLQVVALPDDRHPSTISESDYLRSFDNLFREIVSAHMISDVALGAFLSGGIDSSLVTAVMSQLSGKPVKTFTIGFYDKYRDEAPHARKIAEYLGTEHYESYLAPADVFDAIPAMVNFYDEPFGDSSALPTYLISKFAKQHVTVALAGDGGDELFGGYTRYGRSQKIFQMNCAIPSSLRNVIASALQKLPFDKLQRVGTGIQYDNPIEVFHYLVAMWKGKSHEQLIGQTYDFTCNTKFYTVYRHTEAYQLLTRLMMVDFNTYLPDDGLTKVDRASMAHGLEVRVPLLDNAVVEFALKLPLKYKINGNIQKYFLKQLLSKYIPSELYERPKKGFVVPLNDWLRGELRFLVDEYLHSDRIRARGLLNSNVIDQVVRKHMSGQYDYFYMLWPIIVLEMWFEKWVD